MEQPKKKKGFTMEQAEKKRDSLSYEASSKQQAGYQAKNFSTSQILMENARKDQAASDAFKRGIAEAKERVKKK
jgi:hypothetical protein